MLVGGLLVPTWICNNGNHVFGDVRRKIGNMARQFRTCEYCGGALDPGEKCDCQKIQNRNYTSIEGAGYKPVSIRPISYYNKKPDE